MANLFPRPAALVESHRALLRVMFAEPARHAGCDRWGAKFVRLGIESIAYLRFLFPRASIVFIHRDPYESWASYRAARLMAYERFPGEPVFDAFSFGRLWARHVEGVLAAAPRFDVLCVSYDELIDPTISFRHKLEDHLGLQPDWSLLNTVIDIGRGRCRSERPLYAHEQGAIRLTAGRAAKRLGYHAS